MTKFFLLLLLIFYLNETCGQVDRQFPLGISTDSTIEEVCKSVKNLNSFKVVHFINDSISTNPLLKTFDKLPFRSYVTFDNKDTLITFLRTLTPFGVQIQLKETGCEVVTFTSSRSCECYKSSLEDPKMGYGAAAKPASLILVMSKMKNIKIGDKIYGYIKTQGGDLFHFKGNENKYDKWRFEFEGFFEIEFQSLVETIQSRE